MRWRKSSILAGNYRKSNYQDFSINALYVSGLIYDNHEEMQWLNKLDLLVKRKQSI